MYNEQDVLDYLISDIGGAPFKNDDLQFKIYLIKEFKSETPDDEKEWQYKDKSCVIFTYSHTLCDGISSFLLLNMI
jgi:hypothetical protein